jgi:hypothetical protein
MAAQGSWARCYLSRFRALARRWGTGELALGARRLA